MNHEHYSADSDPRDEPVDAFIRLLTDHQVDLQAFIMSSLGNHPDTLDVLQATNIALWKKASVFDPTAPFLPWAIGVARFEVLAFMRKKRRDRHTFSPEVVELLMDVAAHRTSETSCRSRALMECIKELPERNREFLQIRYAQQQSVRQVASKTGRTVEAVKSLYLRIRRALEHCIDRRLALEERL
ncbi:sigma-70 family RNA polymerase sigma factor [Aeoliella mucimassa]|uniref:RNA polymerase sigma factor SigV n=1 Tax=Aeoliella mucimassa TaxID=2527972 RepID=A0A518AGR4_9BACT|nr:sigma-70 family RNA polymerase sigma factor [Aeoliella mucimassa]QDU53907.1 RNA polymerase sigma factor SigV [Aeoliella mucimassa]